MRTAAIPVVALACALLAGCVQSVAVETKRGVPEGRESAVDLLDPTPFATWLDDRDRFAVVTFGSSSCAPVPTSVLATDAATIAVTFVQASAQVCSADLAATTHVFTTPGEIDSQRPVTVDVLLDYSTDYEFSVPVLD